jgi:S-ribosylhomocysteine lyase
MKEVNRIASFSVDHDFIVPGVYISRIDGDVVTYDLRTRVPNAGDYMDNLTMHSVEHMFATYVRNSALSDKVIYFGPMGCQTGFYLLVRDEKPESVYDLVIETLGKIVAHEGEIFGKARRECGNFENLDITAAKREAERYLKVLCKNEWDFIYKE